MSITKTEIQLNVNGKSVNAYLAAPENGGPGVLVLHAWWGLKPFFKQVCDQLAEQGFTALAPDLYQGHVGKTIDEAKALLAEFEQGDPDLMGNTVEAAKKYLSNLRAGQPIGVIGFSMGAAWSMIVAANATDVSAVVLFYGAYAPDLSKMKAKVLGHFAEVDEWEPLDGVKAVEKEMHDAGVDVTLHIYPGAAHWFVESDRPEYDSAAASLAWSRTYEFLKENL
jgi:carboxymethylenebutenolidase